MVDPLPGDVGVGVGVSGGRGVAVYVGLEMVAGVDDMARVLNEISARNKAKTMKGRVFFIGQIGRVGK